MTITNNRVGRSSNQITTHYFPAIMRIDSKHAGILNTRMTNKYHQNSMTFAMTNKYSQNSITFAMTNKYSYICEQTCRYVEHSNDATLCANDNPVTTNSHVKHARKKKIVLYQMSTRQVPLTNIPCNEFINKSVTIPTQCSLNKSNQSWFQKTHWCQRRQCIDNTRCLYKAVISPRPGLRLAGYRHPLLY